MALVLCPECGEETLDRLVNCPLCNEPLAHAVQKAKSDTVLFTSGLLFLAGLTAATICNSLGYTRMAIALGIIGLVSLATLIVKLKAQ